MALRSMTPRDKLQRLVDLGRATLRYAWVIVVVAVVGGSLTLAFALLKPKTFQSWATLFYQERIQSSLMAPNREEVAQRNIGDRYRELLLARSQLDQIVNDPALDPFPRDDRDLALDKLRLAIKFEPRGTNGFRIAYSDRDPDRAKAITDRLTRLLQDKDEELRNDQASRTVIFATTQKEAASTALRKAEQALAEFLAKHPEFAQDANTPNTEGASIRAIRNQRSQSTGSTRMYALERQRQRIQARLDARPDQPPIPILMAPTPERIAAEAAASEAQRELGSANRELEDALSRYTNRHPSVIKAQARVAAAQQKLRSAQAAVPPRVETVFAPATPEDRERLQKELAQVESQLGSEQQRGGAKATSVADATTNWVVKLETEHANLRREVSEQRERVESLAASVFRAQIDASQKLAEQGSRLSVVDPAFRPVRPTGPGTTIYLVAGMILFVALGASLAIGLAVVDDRLYHRSDLAPLGVTMLGEIPVASQRILRTRRTA